MAHKHETVLEAGSIRARVARVYAEALAAAALRHGGGEASVVSVGEELDQFVAQVLDASPAVEAFLASPAVGKKAKSVALEAALTGRASDLLRGLFFVLLRNGRLDLTRGIAAAYRDLLDQRAGRVRVRVTTAVELSDAQTAAITATLAAALRKQPVLELRLDPGLIGGMVVQIGDRVIDTSVRTRLTNLRTHLLDKGSTYVLQQV